MKREKQYKLKCYESCVQGNWSQEGDKWRRNSEEVMKYGENIRCNVLEYQGNRDQRKNREDNTKKNGEMK